MDYLFNPYEIAFCGNSGSGKTTLITHLLKRLSSKYKIGYVKHSGHGFSIDKKGKDSYRAAESGASSVMVADSDHSAIIDFTSEISTRQSALMETEIVFIEGFKDSSIPKVVLIEDKKDNELIGQRFRNVMCVVGKDSDISSNVPYFSSEDVESIKNFVVNYFKEKVVPVYGLVLTGGYSKRMKKEKSTLSYHGIPQAKYCYDLLSSFCEKIFISTREEQTTDFPRINDKFVDFGPVSGILSAMISNPNVAWFVLACDMPFVEKETLSSLMKARNPFKSATVFIGEDGPEPLCTIYEPKSIHSLLRNIGFGKYSPRDFLRSTNTEIVKPEKEYWLDNINTLDEFKEVRKEIQKLNNNTVS